MTDRAEEIVQRLVPWKFADGTAGDIVAALREAGLLIDPGEWEQVGWCRYPFMQSSLVREKRHEHDVVLYRRRPLDPGTPDREREGEDGGR